ncbi:ATP-binding protein [Zhouia spongiae]|uniref:ATP-binding protein n=1 Tax=Zhouia spongiae TaxID=2202721 RepID=A0ABY3YIU8_9FLAO|nr:ATP-binding protein [Zhouia spongiae]UNY97784.1 ATP-binding protein [Zhouia spongiae]
MSHKKIVITGGPGTGKTSVVEILKQRGHVCFPEISRQVTLEAQKQGIEQLFLEDPLLFSKKLLEGRVSQFKEALNHPEKSVFLDRGIPDVVAYLDYANQTYPPYFTRACEQHTYDKIFLLPPWEDIYISDNERYENFEQAVLIHDHLEAAYKRYGYHLVEVPTGTVDLRADFIEKNL